MAVVPRCVELWSHSLGGHRRISYLDVLQRPYSQGPPRIEPAHVRCIWGPRTSSNKNSKAVNCHSFEPSSVPQEIRRQQFVFRATQQRRHLHSDAQPHVEHRASSSKISRCAASARVLAINKLKKNQK